MATRLDRATMEVLAAAVLMGLVPIIVKGSTLDSYSLAIGRVFFAALSLWVWVAFSSRPRAVRFDLRLLAFGLLHAATIMLSFVAIKRVNTAVAAILLFAGGIYLVVLSPLLLGERMRRSTLFAVALAACGLLAIFGFPAPGHDTWGYLAGWASGVTMAFVYVLGKVLVRREDMLVMTALQNSVALPLLAPLALRASFALTPANVLTIAGLGIGCTALPFVLLYAALRHVSAQRVGVLLMLEIVTPIVLSVVLLGEVPRLGEAIGGAALLLGSVVVIVRGEPDSGAADVVRPEL